jgi:hypothetical protein
MYRMDGCPGAITPLVTIHAMSVLSQGVLQQQIVTD